MQIVHTQRFVRMSPRKLRIVADVVRMMDAQKAIEILPFTGKRAAEPLSKVLKTAVANAKDQKIAGQLVVKEVQINEGPSLKRGRAASRGRWQPYKRHMSHIRIVLEEVEVKPVAVKEKPAKKVETEKKAKIEKKTVKETKKK